MGLSPNCGHAEVQETKVCLNRAVVFASERYLGGTTFVAMMQPTNLRDFDHLA